MNDKTPDTLASDGLEILKRSVLLTLYAIRRERIPFLHATEIGKRLGILPTRWEREGDNSLILSVLNRLEMEKRVEKLWIGTYKWQITPEGVLVIEGQACGCY